MSRGYIISSKIIHFLEENKSFWSNKVVKYKYNRVDIYQKCENYYILIGNNKLIIYLRSHLDQLPYEQTVCHQWLFLHSPAPFSTKYQYLIYYSNSYSYNQIGLLDRSRKPSDEVECISNSTGV